MNASEKLNTLLSYFDTNKNKLGTLIKKRQSLYDIESGKIKSFSPELVKKIKEVYPSINEDFFLFDAENMILSRTGNMSNEDFISHLPVPVEKMNPTAKDALKQLGKIQKNKNKENSQLGNGQISDAKIPLTVTIIPSKAQLGLQSFVYADELMAELDKKTIYRDKEYKGSYYEIECIGDSMNDGTEHSIKDGDFVLCRDISRMHWKNKLHINDWVFVIFHREKGIIVKQIIDHNTETGDLLLHSFNPDKTTYTDFTININQCEKICNVVEVRKIKKGKYGY